MQSLRPQRPLALPEISTRLTQPEATPFPSNEPPTPRSWRKKLASRSFWLPLGLAVVMLAAGGGIGWAARSGELQRVEARSLSRVDDVRGDLDVALERAASAEAARFTAEDRMAEMEEELADGLAELRQREKQLDQREKELDEREADIAGQERQIEQNSFDDGIWQVGVDFAPGLYRAPGGSGCYWALLGSADTWDIINNGGFSENQTLQIDSPWFETSDCGTWTKIG